MFKSYIFYSRRINGEIEIFDTEFYEIISPSINDGTLGSFNYMLYNIVKVYEKKEMNVAANIALYFSFLEKRYNSKISISEWLEEFKDEKHEILLYNYVFDKYGKDIEKYLLLI